MTRSLKAPCLRYSPSELKRLKLGTIDFAKQIEDLKAFNAGIARKIEERKPVAQGELIGTDLQKPETLKDGASAAQSDPMNELLGLSIQDVLGTNSVAKDENLMDLAFDAPLVFDRQNVPNSDPSDLNLLSMTASSEPVQPPLKSSDDPFDFDMSVKKEPLKTAVEQHQVQKDDDPFGFL